jgi:flagellar basal-body rod modification protein FlgD
MSISGASAATSNPVSSAAVNNAASSAGISSTDFLTLLVDELQNQDPLDPTDTSDFVNQMSQYANFDQEQTLNTNLGNLLTSFNSLLTMNSINYLGHTVEVKGDTTSLQNGQATFGYSLTGSASNVALTIKDAAGDTVWSGTGPSAAGMNSFTWDGTTNDGTKLSDGGQYTLSVAATDASGKSVYGYTTFSGKVDDVDNSSGSTMLDIGGVPVSISNVVGVTS